MKMVNMERSAAEMKACGMCCAEGEDPKPEYPYGLRISLGKPELDKLGVSELPAIGTEMMLQVKVRVVSASASANERGEEMDAGLQITDMAMDAPKKPAAEIMYS